MFDSLFEGFVYIKQQVHMRDTQTHRPCDLLTADHYLLYTVRAPIESTRPSALATSQRYDPESAVCVSLMTSDAVLSQYSISYLRPGYSCFAFLNQQISASREPSLTQHSRVATSGVMTVTSVTPLMRRGASPTTGEK